MEKNFTLLLKNKISRQMLFESLKLVQLFSHKPIIDYQVSMVKIAKL